MPSVSSASSSYSTTTLEKLVPETADNPIVTFDTSDLRCTLDLKSPLQVWNRWLTYVLCLFLFYFYHLYRFFVIAIYLQTIRWATDFNTAWEDYKVKTKTLKAADQVHFEWAANQVVDALKAAKSATGYFRESQKQLATAAPGGTAHPAVNTIEEEIKKGIALVRDARDEFDEYYEKSVFADKVGAHLANAKLAYAEAAKDRERGDGITYIENYRGEDYRFGDSGGGRGYVVILFFIIHFSLPFSNCLLATTSATSCAWRLRSATKQKRFLRLMQKARDTRWLPKLTS